MKIAVAGTGYVGLVTGVCLAEHGHLVTCVDVDEKKVELMKKGVSPIYEEGLPELMAKNMERLTFTTDYASAYRDAEVIFIGVGTPEKVDGSANLKYVYTVAKQIAQSVEKDCVVVVKSTVPIGTNDKVEDFIRSNLVHSVNIDVASNPEFLAQGTAVRDTLHASRIVIGAENNRCRETLEKVYKTFDAPKLITDRRSAEMIKYASNDFLALKISYINEIANFCETIGANIEDVAAGMGFDSRIGNKFLKAGIGYGGSCFPKDTKALHWLGNYYDQEFKTIKALGFQKVKHIVVVPLNGLPVLFGALAFGELEVVCHQPLQSRKGPEEYALDFCLHLFGKVGIIHAVNRFLFGGQNQLPPIEAVASVKEGLQVAVAECQQAGRHPPLITLLALALQIHLTLRGDDGFNVVGLPQRLHPHIVIDTQQNVFQISAGETVLGNFADAAIFHIAAEQGGQHRADLALALAAAAFDNHHPLAFVAGDQAVADIFLQSRNVLRVKQPIQKRQPAGWCGSTGIVGHRQTTANNLRLALRKGAIQH